MAYDALEEYLPQFKRLTQVLSDYPRIPGIITAIVKIPAIIRPDFHQFEPYQRLRSLIRLVIVVLERFLRVFMVNSSLNLFAKGLNRPDCTELVEKYCKYANLHIYFYFFLQIFLYHVESDIRKLKIKNFKK